MKILGSVVLYKLSLYVVFLFPLVTLYFYPKITSLFLGVPSSLTHYLTDCHNYEFIGKTAPSLKVHYFSNHQHRQYLKHSTHSFVSFVLNPCPPVGIPGNIRSITLFGICQNVT